MSKRTDSSGLGSLSSGALTAASMLAVTIVAATVGIVIAREFGRTEETDGFFAAYGVFIVVTIAAQAIRVAVLPTLARAREERRLAGELAGFAIALAVVAVPLVMAAVFAAGTIGSLLTGGESDVAADAAADALRWIVPAATLYLFAGLAASGLAALDDYGTAALGFALGGVAGLTLILARVGEDGLDAVVWGMALNATVASLIPIAALAYRAHRRQMPPGAMRPTGLPLRIRLGGFAAAASLPLALQMLYVVCLPFAGRIEAGAVTSLGYAYLGAASTVMIAAFSLGLVTSVPLSRLGLEPERTARHVIASSWIALVLVGLATGVCAVAGADVVEAVLGDAYGNDVGDEVARLVVVLAPFMVVSVGVNVAFPLAFVAEHLRPLPWIGAAALAVQVPLAWALGELLGLEGLGVALAASTFLVLAALLRELGALRAGLRGMAAAAIVIGVIAVAGFVPPSLVLGAGAAAVVGSALYAVLLALARPPGLRSSWAYLRALR